MVVNPHGRVVNGRRMMGHSGIPSDQDPMELWEVYLPLLVCHICILPIVMDLVSTYMARSIEVPNMALVPSMPMITLLELPKPFKDGRSTMQFQRSHGSIYES